MIGFKLPDYRDSEIDDKSDVRESLLRGSIGRPEDEEAEDPEEAHRLRNKYLMSAIYSEFIGTVLCFLPLFAILANNKQEGYEDGAFNRFSAGVIRGINLVCMIMCFSSLSGSIFNPAIAFSLWLVGKLSNRKTILFIAAELAASLFCMFIIYATFPHASHQGIWQACTMRPIGAASSWNVFFTEFITTFMLTYVEFAMAFEEAESVRHSTMSIQAKKAVDGLVVYGSTPTSQLGFAPFALGFLVFALTQYGGGAGPSMNPVRMFGPAVMSGVWDSWHVYVLGDFVGAGAAALLAVHGPQSARRAPPAEAPPQTLLTLPSPGSSLPMVGPVADSNV